MPGAGGIDRRWVVAAALAAIACHLLIHPPGTGVRTASAQWPTWLNEPPKPVTFPDILVDAGWLKQHRTDPGLVIIDVQGEEPYKIGHLPGALLGLGRSDLGVSFPASPVQSAKSLLLYTEGPNSTNAGNLLFALDAAHEWRTRPIRVLNGGLAAWRLSGGEITSVPPKIPGEKMVAYRRLTRAGLLPERPDTTVTIDIPTLATRYGRPGLTIVDPRPIAEWEKGHIPHSLPVNFDEFRNDDGTLMDGPTMRPILASFGPRDRDFINLNDAFVIAGLPPATSTVHPYLALRVMGIPSVRLLPSSFEEWRRAGLPVTRVVHAPEMTTLMEKAHPGRMTDRPAPSMILFDLRHVPDFNYSHLPGEMLLQPDRLEAQLDSVVKAHWPGVDRATIPFAVYCYGPDCIRSRNATTKAAQMGFRNLLWFRDGPQGFRSAGGKLFGVIAK